MTCTPRLRLHGHGIGIAGLKVGPGMVTTFRELPVTILAVVRHHPGLVEKIRGLSHGDNPNPTRHDSFWMILHFISQTSQTITGWWFEPL